MEMARNSEQVKSQMEKNTREKGRRTKDTEKVRGWYKKKKAGKTATKTAQDVTEIMILKIVQRKVNSERNVRKSIMSLQNQH